MRHIPVERHLHVPLLPVVVILGIVIYVIFSNNPQTHVIIFFNSCTEPTGLGLRFQGLESIQSIRKDLAIMATTTALQELGFA